MALCFFHFRQKIRNVWKGAERAIFRKKLTNYWPDVAGWSSETYQERPFELPPPRY